jgi:hypothetical protein
LVREIAERAANLTLGAAFAHVTAKAPDAGESQLIAVSADSSVIAGEFQMEPRVLLA